MENGTRGPLLSMFSIIELCVSLKIFFFQANEIDELGSHILF